MLVTGKKSTADRETPRTILKMPSDEYAEDFARILSNSEVVKHFGKNGDPISRQESDQALQDMIMQWQDRGFGRWAVVLKESGKLIGCAGLKVYQGRPELFYLLDQPFWGQGLATEIAQAALCFGFERLHFEEIIAFTKHQNRASQRVLEKVGFSLEGEDQVFDISALKYNLRHLDYFQKRSDEKSRMNASGARKTLILKTATGAASFG